jgi:type I restriction-modification system DNA methylase subunit
MIWIAPTEKDTTSANIEKNLLASADQFRANSGLKAQEYSAPIHGVEKTDETGRLCRLNLAVHGLEGDIRHGGQVNSYYDDPHGDRWLRTAENQLPLVRTAV